MYDFNKCRKPIVMFSSSTYIYVLFSIGRTYEKEVGPLSRKIGQFVSTDVYSVTAS